MKLHLSTLLLLLTTMVATSFGAKQDVMYRVTLESRTSKWTGFFASLDGKHGVLFDAEINGDCMSVTAYGLRKGSATSPCRPFKFVQFPSRNGVVSTFQVEGGRSCVGVNLKAQSCQQMRQSNIPFLTSCVRRDGAQCVATWI
jgi:hypothetical protein